MVGAESGGPRPDKSVSCETKAALRHQERRTGHYGAFCATPNSAGSIVFL
jgi:hypothetical protein